MSNIKKEKVISLNKKARYHYFIEKRLEAGIVLAGWEVKSLRAAKAQIHGSYILLKAGEAFLFGALITPLSSVSTHLSADPQRTRKLLLNRREIDMLIGVTERKGAAVIPIALYWRRGRVKLEIGIARGKKLYDKRQVEKERDWRLQQARMRKC